MAGGPTTLSEAREQEYTQAISRIALGGVILVVAILLIIILGYVPAQMGMPRMIAGLFALAGAVILGLGIWRIIQSRNIRTVTFRCPYCNADNRLLQTPTEDFECENCKCTIRFENGRLAPIRTITCSHCGAEHRVSTKAERCICDQCNAVIQLQSQHQSVYGMTPSRSGPAGPKTPGTLLGDPNQDVLIQSYDRSREQQVAAILQRELGVDLNEARRLLGTITDRTPLIVACDIPHDAANTLRKQFEQLGAVVHMRAAIALRG